MSEQLRDCLSQWGLPKAIRVDNGDPWATRSDLPSALALWLVGLNVKVILNRPHQSTDNGIVERTHGVLANWLEPHRAHTVADLQAQLDWAIAMQRNRYPVRHGQSRLQAYPDLCQNPRPYSRSQEPELWQLERVDTWLSQAVWLRRVDKVGRISFFSIAYSIGRAYAGHDVLIHFDRHQREWVIETEQGYMLKRFDAQQITPERICHFDLAKRANSLSHPSS